MVTDNRHKQLGEKEQYEAAIELLRQGGVVAAPTDTVYGLLSVAADRAAVQRVFEIKRRPLEQPLPLFVGSIEQAQLIADMNAAAREFVARFWPGALTMIVPKKDSYGTLAASGGDSIGLRAPADPVLREIAQQLGPLTGTSANRSGQPECRTADEVRQQLGDDVDLIVEAKQTAIWRARLRMASSSGPALPSTIVDCTQPACRVVRAGDVTRDALREALAGVADLI